MIIFAAICALFAYIAFRQVNKGLGIGGDTIWEQAAKKAKEKREKKFEQHPKDPEE